MLPVRQQDQGTDWQPWALIPARSCLAGYLWGTSLLPSLGWGVSDLPLICRGHELGGIREKSKQANT